MSPAPMKCIANSLINDRCVSWCLCRWEIMKSCWLVDPKKRSKFSGLASKLCNLLDSDSSYLRL